MDDNPEKLFLLNNCYSNTYLGARGKFTQLVRNKGGKHSEIKLDNVCGSENEDLFIDIAHFGDNDPDTVIIHISGIHGVEAYAGAAIQQGIISEIDDIIKIPDKTALVFIHCVNPYGMSHYRFANENNVDLDTNYNNNLNINKTPELYKEMNPIINPTEEVCNWTMYYFVKLLPYKFKYSTGELYKNLSSGQSCMPKGLFYSGKTLEKSLNKMLLHIKTRYGGASKVIIIDVHTGIGYYGRDTISIDSNEEDTELISVLNKNKYNYSYITTDISKDNKKLTNVIVQGLSSINNVIFTQKFGTYTGDNLITALCCENYYHNYQHTTNNHISKMSLLRMFYPENAVWRLSVLTKGIKLYKELLNYYAS